MEQTTDKGSAPCESFRASLDLWLASELDAGQDLVMQAHHDGCTPCQQETRLARAITTITVALPELQLPIAAQGHRDRKAGLRAPSLLSRLCSAWRQPLVFAPALALALLAVLLWQFRVPGPAIDPQVVIIDGEEFTREEILRATEDLELALRYLDKYASYPAKVVQAELEQSQLPLPPRADTASPAI